MTTLIISNDEMNDIIKIVKYLEDSDLFLKGVTESSSEWSKRTKMRIS